MFFLASVLMKMTASHHTDHSINCIPSTQDESSDEERSHHGRGPAKRAARHSVDAEVPNQSISHFYPKDDNYIPQPNNLRSPKPLTDLCVDALCRSLPNLEGGELPPGLPQVIVDRILQSLTAHGALNSTTLRSLRNCEFGVLNLANCRGVSDEWLSPLGSGSVRSSSPASMTGEQRSRSASTSLYKKSRMDESTQGGYRSVPPPPLKSINPERFVLSPSHLSSFMDVAPTSPMMMDVNDVYDQMEDSSSTASFLSAFSTPYAPSTQESGAERRPTSPLLPSVLPPPDFFSMKKSPNPPSFALTPSPLMQRSINLLPHASSLHTKESEGEQYNEPYNHNMSFDESQYGGATSTITELDLRGSQRLTDRGLLQLSHAPLLSLENAKLDNCHGITGRGLLAFSQSQRLRTLSLANCRRLTDEAVVNVSHLSTSLVAVNLGGCRCLTDRSLEALGGLLGLTKLDLSQVCLRNAR